MTLLTDIGGTYIRCAILKDDAPSDIQKYEAAKFPDLQSALAQYCEDTQHRQGGELRIATAGYEEDGLWKFVNQNKWEISPQSLSGQGWNVTKILNDFEAATWSLLNTECGDIQTLRGGKAIAGLSRCLLGPGTGLGLGYLHFDGKNQPYVQKTHGGHIPAAALNDEQYRAIQDIGQAQDTVVVFENLASGTGLLKLRELYDAPKADRLFHEFLGLFAAGVVVSGHAYGGLYLTGGALERLIEDNLFDFERFENAFCINAAVSVKSDLQNTPIIHMTYPYPALKGLINA